MLSPSFVLTWYFFPPACGVRGAVSAEFSRCPGGGDRCYCECVSSASCCTQLKSTGCYWKQSWCSAWNNICYSVRKKTIRKLGNVCNQFIYQGNAKTGLHSVSYLVFTSYQCTYLILQHVFLNRRLAKSLPLPKENEESRPRIDLVVFIINLTSELR